jgi:hypothetical protein
VQEEALTVRPPRCCSCEWQADSRRTVVYRTDWAGQYAIETGVLLVRKLDSFGCEGAFHDTAYRSLQALKHQEEALRSSEVFSIALSPKHSDCSKVCTQLNRTTALNGAVV